MTTEHLPLNKIAVADGGPGTGRSPEVSARRRGTRRIFAGGALLVTIALAAIGCSSTADTTDGVASTDGTVSRANTGIVESTDEPKIGGHLVYALLSETNGWNPSTNQWALSGLEVAHSIFDTLTAFDEKSEIHPYLAESYSHNENFTEWKINLRPGIKLHNGKTVTADTIVRNQNYLKKSPITGGAYIKVDGYSAEDENTVVVKLNEPWVTYPMSLATQLGVVADADWLESNDGLKPIGTGPFVFGEWKIGDKLDVTRNPSYWRKDKDGISYPYLDSVEFRVLADSDSRGNALRAGDIDMMESWSGVQVQAFRADPEFQVLSNPEGETTEQFVQLNTMVPPLDDRNARLALAYATDKHDMNEALNGGFNELANGPFAPSSPWYKATDYPQFDQAKAKELVEQVKQDHGSFTFKLSGGPDPRTQQELQLLQQQWKAVGIDVELETLDLPRLIINVVSGSYQASVWDQFDAPNPTLDGVWWEPQGAVEPPTFSLNFARNKDDAIGMALATARGSDDPATVKAAVGTVQDRLAADVPYVWIYHASVAIIATTRIVNMTKYTLPDGAAGLDLIQGSHPLYQVWFKDR